MKTPSRSLVAISFALVACRSDMNGSGPSGHPALDIGPDLRGYSGHEFSLTARVNPQGATRESFRWTLSWGDGASDSGSLALPLAAITAAHTYATTGQFPVRLSLLGTGAGDTASDTLTAIVDPPGTPEVFIGAGDIAACGIEATLKHAAATGQLVAETQGTVFAAGDEAYPAGAPADYATCYDPLWGSFKKRTRPVPGNHDYDTPAADGYFDYYGAAAGDSATGYYSFDLGAWHILMLNSNFHDKRIPLGPELAWVQADLLTHPSRCTLALFHHPRFSSGITHGSDTLMIPLWQVLYDGGVDVIVNGHEHNYERFAPQTPSGGLDTVRGIREFVVGTGGSGYYPLGAPIANSQDTTTDHGVLKLTLTDSAYHWEFVSIPNYYSNPHSDSGTTVCH